MLSYEQSHKLSRILSFQHADAKETVTDSCYCYYFQVNLFSRIRLAKHFPIYEKRLQCIQARLQAISVLCKNCS